MSSRKLFVAGPSSIRETVQQIIDVCREAGWEITEDWTRAKGWDEPVTREVLMYANVRNSVAVLDADALLYVCHDLHPSAGAACEATMAYEGRPVVVLWLNKSRQGAGACYALSFPCQHETLADALETLDNIMPLEVTV